MIPQKWPCISCSSVAVGYYLPYKEVLQCGTVMRYYTHHHLTMDDMKVEHRICPFLEPFQSFPLSYVLLYTFMSPWNLPQTFLIQISQLHIHSIWHSFLSWYFYISCISSSLLGFSLSFTIVSIILNKSTLL